MKPKLEINLKSPIKKGVEWRTMGYCVEEEERIESLMRRILEYCIEKEKTNEVILINDIKDYFELKVPVISAIDKLILSDKLELRVVDK